MGGFKVEKINHVGIPTDDRGASIDFYRDLIGLEVIPTRSKATRWSGRAPKMARWYTSSNPEMETPPVSTLHSKWMT